MSTLTLPYPAFVNGPGNIIDANQVNANNTAIVAVVNGGIDNANIASSAGIALSKLGLSPGGAALNKSTTGGQTWASGLTTDTQAQIEMTADLGLRFGPGGVTAPDVLLKRTAANTLQLQKGDGTPSAKFDMDNGNIINVATIALLSTNAATISPAAMGGNRAVTFPDPGGAASLFCANGALANHAVVKFDGSIYQGISPGTAGQMIRSNGTDFIAISPYQSADQTITAAGTLTLTHGLGYTPLQVWYALVCQTGEANYTAGQVVQVGGMTTGTANQGFSCVIGSTTLVIRFGSGATTFSLPDATTGAVTALTNANWKIRFFCS